jgi:hypothetical protein
LNASNVASGTLAVARGGTGTASPSLVAGSGIAISGTWPNQTVATSGGGGVTSLNGQTGAITNTGYNTIGSYTVAYPATDPNTQVNVSVGDTFSGSNLRVNITSNSSHGVGSQFQSFVSVTGGTFSGTWRCMSRLCQYPADNGYFSALWVRIS